MPAPHAFDTPAPTRADPGPFPTPLPYDPSMEYVAADEAETIEKLKEAMLKISSITHADSGHAWRSVHAKSLGILHGRMQVLDGLPPQWAQGVFAHAGHHAVVMRLSTPPGDVLDDKVSVPRAIAIKVLDVDGDRLPGSEGDTTQDFVMVNGPAFLVADAKKFLGSVKLLAATTDKAEGLKKVFSAALRGLERALESVGGESGAIKGLGGHPMTHPLGETFYTQAPLRHGRYMAKLSLAPVSPELTALTGEKVDLSGRPNGLRDAVCQHFSQHGGEWELRAQLCTDLETMPIEDASVVWPEDESPYIALARITALPQITWDDDQSPAIDDKLSFSPWHGIEDHRPIGSVMRARQAVYAASVDFRGKHNGCPMHQPRSLEDVWPGNGF